jgi:protein-tyrosine phosphatase
MNQRRLRSGAAILVLTLAIGAVGQPGWRQADSWQGGESEPAAAAPGDLAVHLAGAPNFRDLGGLVTTDGRRVKSGLLFRSQSLDRLTAADRARLSTLGVKTIVDLRSNEERMSHPQIWSGSAAPRQISSNYSLASNAYGQALRRDGLMPADAHDIMANVYRDMPASFAPQYRMLFSQLRYGATPLVFNCTGGKDRTGVAAALLLALLGVSKPQIIDDYLRSGQYHTSPYSVGSGGESREMTQHDRVLAVVMGVDRDFIQAALDAVDQDKGGVEAYLMNDLGLSRQDLQAIRNRYLEPA